jgi:hypothetical protein
MYLLEVWFYYMTTEIYYIIIELYYWIEISIYQSLVVIMNKWKVLGIVVGISINQ